jgi:MoxR-like ATPase
MTQNPPAVPVAANPSAVNAALTAALRALSGIIIGKPEQIRLSLVCLLAGGHLLIEDKPGVGKTTLALALARVMGLDFKRVQFTSDLLPADIIGTTVYSRENEKFVFKQGPVFTNLLLADEINRASSKTQSALLEAMEERTVTVDGLAQALPKPFFVIATQNPLSQIGTFALPESQLDRFLIRISLGLPGRAAERELLAGADRRSVIAAQAPLLNHDDLLALQLQVRALHVSDKLLDYVQQLVDKTRTDPHLADGVSPRGSLALLACARASAYLAGRNYVIPEDVQGVFAAVVGHRVGVHASDASVAHDHTAGTQIAQRIVAETAVINV